MTMKCLIKYEKAFCALVGAPAARATALGRQAMVLLLKAVGVKKGDKVGVCGFTCLSVLEAVKVVEAEPVYLDVDESLCIAPESILKQEVGSMKVVILQHTFGNPGKLDQLLDCCRKINTIVIEDCAHALGCFWKGKPLGQFGIGAIYSFQWGKPYTTGRGGMLTVNSEDLLERIDALISEYSTEQTLLKSIFYAIQRTFFNIMHGTGLEIKLRCLYRSCRDMHRTKIILNDSKWKFTQGYIERPDKLTVKAGLHELKKWPENMKVRREKTKVIKQQLQANNIKLWPEQKEADITYLRYPVRVSSKPELLNRALVLSLDLAGWYISPVHPLGYEELKKVGYVMGTAAHAEKIIETFVHMPTGRAMTLEKLSSYIKLIKSYAILQ